MSNFEEPGLVKVSAVQSSLKRFDREYNIRRNLEMIEKEAQSERPHVICVPNYFFQTGMEPVPGPATERMAALSEEYDLYIVGGAAEYSAGEKGYNTGFITFPDGSTHVFQRKIHMIPMESRKLQGGCAYSVLDLPIARVGCVLCNDIFYPEVARCIALDGAEIIFVPSVIGGIGVRGLEVAARARAVENQVFLVNANGIPREASLEHHDLEMGYSGIYGPFLEKIDLVRAGREETVIRAVLDLDELRELKETVELDAMDHSQLARGKSFNMLANRRPEAYNRLVDGK